MGRCVYRTRTRRSQSYKLLVEEINKLDTTLAMKIIYFRLNRVGVVGERKEDKRRWGLGGILTDRVSERIHVTVQGRGRD